jgi:hypothetical protein
LCDARQLRRLRETAVLRDKMKEMQLVDIEWRCLQEFMHTAHESMGLMNFTPKPKAAKL